MKLLSGLIELKENWVVRLPYPMTEMEMRRYRFDPIATPIIIGTMLAGTAVSAYGMYQQGQAAEAQGEQEEAIAKYNAELREREAKAELDRAMAEAEQFGERGEGLMASQRVGYARAGVLGTEGSPALLMEETRFNLEEDRMKIINEGYLSQSFAMAQAEGMRFEGRAAAIRGKNAKLGAMYGMTGSILTGVGSAAYASSNLGGGFGGKASYSRTSNGID